MYLSNPHSKGLSSLSKSLPHDKRPLSILSIKFGQPGLTLNSLPAENSSSYKSNPAFLFST